MYIIDDCERTCRGGKSLRGKGTLERWRSRGCDEDCEADLIAPKMLTLWIGKLVSGWVTERDIVLW